MVVATFSDSEDNEIYIWAIRKFFNCSAFSIQASQQYIESLDALFTSRVLFLSKNMATEMKYDEMDKEEFLIERMLDKLY